MPGGDRPIGSPVYCTGQDVIDQLNDAFGNINSPIYQKARADNAFSGVTTGADLETAYKNLGIVVSAGWVSYLRGLSSANAEAIASAREIALNQGTPMTTSAHKYSNTIHLSVTVTVSDTLTAISSPFEVDVPSS